VPRRVIVFDVNETLLDLAALDAPFARLFGDASVRRQWFQQMLASAFVSTITGRYADFGTLGRGALEMVAERAGKRLGDADRQAILGTMRRLPPHPEVRDALDRLRERGFRLATLTNSTLEVAEAQMESAGLRPLFEQVLSADTVKRLKPAPEPYRHAAERLGVALGEVRLVAAHFWDVTGALRAGCAAAFVARPGQVLDPNAERPDVVGRDLHDVAERIVAVDS
jgi:2-haloacid dehalogenase